MTALQYISVCKSRDEAALDLATCAGLDGYLGGRVIGDGVVKPFAAQAFYVDDVPGSDWFPDGVSRVLILDSQRKALGIN